MTDYINASEPTRKQLIDAFEELGEMAINHSGADTVELLGQLMQQLLPELPLTGLDEETGETLTKPAKLW